MSDRSDEMCFITPSTWMSKFIPALTSFLPSNEMFHRAVRAAVLALFYFLKYIVSTW